MKWKIGDIVYAEGYQYCPVGTVVERFGCGDLIKISEDSWSAAPRREEIFNKDILLPGTIKEFLPEWEAGLLFAARKNLLPAAVNYRFNPEKGTVYGCPPNYKYHWDFGRVVRVGDRYLAVPSRQPREFATEKEAVEWLI